MTDPRPLRLALEVHLHDDRYHGTNEWPPSPARLFQALVSAGAQGATLSGELASALEWLESLPAPTVAAPRFTMGQPYATFVPNNDLDAEGGNPDRVASIRVAKRIQPRLLSPAAPFVYAWELAAEEHALTQAAAITRLAERLYQLGRGVDMAWATARVVTVDEMNVTLAEHPGRVFRPSLGLATNGGLRLACPQPGSLQSLRARFEANLRRFRVEGAGKKAIRVFVQPPKAIFQAVAYDSPGTRLLFDLRPRDPRSTTHQPSMGAFAVWPLVEVAALVERVRDAIASRLVTAVPELEGDLERGVIGRPWGSFPAAPAEQRVRLIPLPSIGHKHVDRGIRRLLAIVPSDALVTAQDLFWACSGLELPETSRTPAITLVSADERGMLAHYAADEEGSRSWRSVTPVVLPAAARRRRIEPSLRIEEAKGGPERELEERRAAHAVAQALRHAGVKRRLVDVRVQREPFGAKGERAEPFASGTRFEKERLWHVELSLDAPAMGPLVIGDGRFLGLGLMAAHEQERAAFAFEIVDGLVAHPDPIGLASALRRAVLARFQAQIGARRRLPSFVSGHRKDGSPGNETSPHLSFVYDPRRSLLLVVPPHARDHRPVSARERELLDTLQRALTGFDELRAGAAGLLSLRPGELDMNDDLFSPAREWRSVTHYVVNRHAKGVGVEAALARDVRDTCARLRLPVPEVGVTSTRGVPGVGLAAELTLRFAAAISGPLLLGRTRHRGGGLFAATAR
jgi:CRISPR-associated protein Csb2